MKHDDRKLSQIQITLFPSILPAIKRKKWHLNYIIYQKQINVWLYYSIAQLYNLVNCSGLEPIVNKTSRFVAQKYSVKHQVIARNRVYLIFKIKKLQSFSYQIIDSFLQVTFVCIYILMYNVLNGSSSGITGTNCLYCCSGLITYCNFKLSILINFYFHKQNNVKYVRKPVSQHSLQLFSNQISNIHKVTLFYSQRTKCALTLFYNVLSPPVLGQCNIVKGGVSGCVLTSFVSILSLKEEVVFVL
ncbi:Hypothetical_protein [Hexamita inflata]|uniref:Hypothetical_protein n=1 Tax=Hexamita inflata TaxID=28002 RepID=A0AA86PAJ5_9EUKA|nr:Hypothetical protein HINF_LOCUS21776 [Hexamita inflata]